VRDATQGLEVLMVERHRGALVAFSGALVFPGGKVDAEDGELAAAAGARPTAGPDLPFWIAAVRETFEEAGILLARSTAAADEAALVPGDQARRIVETARRQAPDAVSFSRLLAEAGLRPALDQLVHFGHWITPLWAPRRFDTHFFLVAAPEGQDLILDARESASAMWIAPESALAEADAGRHTLVDVTRFTLALLATWPDTATALDEARRRPVVTVLPTRRMNADGSHVVQIPREAGYLGHELLVRRE
jgi:8-oxo-dGTP pyrophosphatase MutT (NUDIX family)